MITVKTIGLWTYKTVENACITYKLKYNKPMHCVGRMTSRRKYKLTGIFKQLTLLVSHPAV